MNVQKVRIRIPEVTGNSCRKYSHFRVQSLHLRNAGKVRPEAVVLSDWLLNTSYFIVSEILPPLKPEQVIYFHS